MATREENLKKLNEKLEKLSDEELEQIAGGLLWPDIRDGINPNISTASNQFSNQFDVKKAIVWN